MTRDLSLLKKDASTLFCFGFCFVLFLSSIDCRDLGDKSQYLTLVKFLIAVTKYPAKLTLGKKDIFCLTV